MTLDYRCAAASLARAESLAGTASTVRAFVLLEFSGAWGRDALRDARLAQPVRDHLMALSRLGVKVLLTRRHGHRGRTTRPRLFVARAEPSSSWLEGVRLGSFEDIVDLDLSPVVRGERVGLTALSDPYLAVCTHGRHDVCCAERGRPLAAALTHRYRGLVWEVSHIGGDRFAGNLLVLPDGLYYGRVSAESASDVIDAHLAGHLDLEHFRGRSSLPVGAQAAEIFLRRTLGETRLAALRCLAIRRAGDVWTVDFARGGQTWRCLVRMHRSEPTQLTCRAGRPNRAPVFEDLGSAVVENP